MTKLKKEPRWIDNLHLLMDAKKLNARRLSLLAGLGATAVRDMLEGRAKSPRYDTVESLAKILQVTPAQLMGGKNITEETIDDSLQYGDLDLLTEIITRLQEAITARNQQLGPQDFAAMVTSLYRQMRPSELTEKKTRTPDLSHNIDQLVTYEDLRRHQAGK